MTVIGFKIVFDWEFGDLMMLTGAGFTKNMGGLISSEMFAQISNNSRVRSNESLRSLMRSSLIGGRDYEEAYSRVLSEDRFTPEEKEIMRSAIVDAYRHLHRKIEGFRFDTHPEHFNLHHFSELITLFNKSGNVRCPIFTLNQDLFFEHEFKWHAPASPTFPMGWDNADGLANPPFQQLTHASWDDVCEGIQMHAGPPYMKLHGSYGWISSTGDPNLIIGSDKQTQIRNEPLLKAYFGLFELLLVKHRNLKILIIGYSFRDPHINEVLLNAVTMNDSKLFIINPGDQAAFYKRLGEAGLDDIVLGIECYYPYTLKQIFFQKNSPEWQQIKADLLAPI
jgi:hypothetical protein